MPGLTESPCRCRCRSCPVGRASSASGCWWMRLPLRLRRCPASSERDVGCLWCASAGSAARQGRWRTVRFRPHRASPLPALRRRVGPPSSVCFGEAPMPSSTAGSVRGRVKTHSLWPAASIGRRMTVARRAASGSQGLDEPGCAGQADHPFHVVGGVREAQFSIKNVCPRSGRSPIHASHTLQALSDPAESGWSASACRHGTGGQPSSRRRATHQTSGLCGLRRARRRHPADPHQPREPYRIALCDLAFQQQFALPLLRTHRPITASGARRCADMGDA
jgi:hypothetical protein